MVHEGRGPTGCRSRGCHGLANPLPFEDETGACVFIIGLEGHHPSLSINGRGWIDGLGSGGS